MIGDLRENNILVNENALVTLVDTDSFQVPDPEHHTIYRCPVGTPEYTPPELQGLSFSEITRTPEHDLFGLAVLIFQLLMEGVHPFAGTFLGDSEPPAYETRIREGHFPYSTLGSSLYRPMPSAPPLRILHPRVQDLFMQCFELGHHDPRARPDAQMWVEAMEEAEAVLVVCSTNAQHRYGKHLTACPWCERTERQNGVDPFPARQVSTGAKASNRQVPLPAPEQAPAAVQPSPSAPTSQVPLPYGYLAGAAALAALLALVPGLHLAMGLVATILGALAAWLSWPLGRRVRLIAGAAACIGLLMAVIGGAGSSGRASPSGPGVGPAVAEQPATTSAPVVAPPPEEPVAAPEAKTQPPEPQPVEPPPSPEKTRPATAQSPAISEPESPAQESTSKELFLPPKPSVVLPLVTPLEAFASAADALHVATLKAEAERIAKGRHSPESRELAKRRDDLRAEATLKAKEAVEFVAERYAMLIQKREGVGGQPAPGAAEREQIEEELVQLRFEAVRISLLSPDKRLSEVLTPGNHLWQATVGTEEVHRPCVSGGRVIVESAGKLYCFDALRGTSKWEYGTGNSGDFTRSLYREADGCIYAAATDGTIHCLEAEHGTQRWQFEGSNGPASFLAVADDRVYAHGSRGRLICLDADNGTKLWEFGRPDRSIVAAAVTGGRVYVAHCGKLHCLHAGRGETVWEFPASERQDDITGYTEFSTPCVANERVYVGRWDGKLYCLDAVRGAKLWEVPAPHGFRVLSEPVVSGKRILVNCARQPSEQGKLCSIDSDSRALSWVCDVASGARLAPLIGRERVFICLAGSRLSCLDAGAAPKVASERPGSSGAPAPLWEAPLAEEPTATP